MKLAQERDWDHHVKEGIFITTAVFDEFPGVFGSYQIDWSKKQYVTASLLIGYSPKFAEACNFKEVINMLNYDYWGVTFAWNNETKQIICKVTETVDKMTIEEADDLLDQLYEHGEKMLVRIYPRDEESQLEWQKDVDQRLLLAKSPPAGRA